MRYLITGGGTLGSVMPLLAVADILSLEDKEAEFVWVGTKFGPEKEVVTAAGIKFVSIHAGKWRRYFDWRLFAAPFWVIAGFIEAFFLLKKFKPDIIINAGSFIGAPLIWAGWFLRIPSWIHQQDVLAGLANKITAPFAKKISVALEETLPSFPKSKTSLVGNPVNFYIDSLRAQKTREKYRGAAIKRFGLQEGVPVVLAIGGGTGSAALNLMIRAAIPKLVNFCQVIHVTGPGKEAAPFSSPRYKHFPFLLSGERVLAFAAADLAVSRAGMGVISECAVSGVAMLLAPMERSHQEANAGFFEKLGAARQLFISRMSVNDFAEKIKQLLANEQELNEMRQIAREIFPANAANNLAREIITLAKKYAKRNGANV